MVFFFLMIRRPPRSTRTTHSFPTRRASDLQEIKKSGHSRFLVGRGQIDEVLGVVRTRDMLDVALQGKPFDLAGCLADPVVVPEGTPVLKLLERFKRDRKSTRLNSSH